MSDNTSCCNLHAEIERLKRQVTELQAYNTTEVEKRRNAENMLSIAEGWLDNIQDEQASWASANFGKQQWFEPMTGVTEEVGELAHALLKQYQGIRGTHEEHEIEAKDAVGHIMIYLMSLCSIKGWKLSTLIEDTWQKVVKKRNWKSDPLNGEWNEKSLLQHDGTLKSGYQCSKCLQWMPYLTANATCCGLPMVPHIVRSTEQGTYGKIV